MNIILAIQKFHNPFLDNFFIFITMLGEEVFGIILFLLIFWCIDKALGHKIMFAFFTSLCLNNSIKDIFMAERPIGKPGIRSLRVDTATGYSFPSGHTQGVTTLLGTIATHMKKRWFTLLSIVIVTLVAISRLYLGVHWPRDVIFGIIFGIISIVFSNYLYKISVEKHNPYIFLILLIPFSIGLLFFKSDDYLKVVSGFLGGYLGYLLELKYINFQIASSFKNGILRLLLGLIVVAVIKFGLKAILPIGSFNNFIRYFLLTLWITAGAPYIFKKISI